MIRLDFRSSQPIYEQIISQYKFLTLQGYLKSGDAIPSVRRLAVDLEITPGTVAERPALSLSNFYGAHLSRTQSFGNYPSD